MRDLVDLLERAGAAVETRRAVGADKVHAGLAEEGVADGDLDGEAPGLGEGGVREAARVVAAIEVLDRDVVDVVVDELTEDHEEDGVAARGDVVARLQVVGQLPGGRELGAALVDAGRLHAVAVVVVEDAAKRGVLAAVQGLNRYVEKCACEINLN